MNQDQLGQYFDYNATTPISPTVLDVMHEASHCFANPSGFYAAAQKSKEIIHQAREVFKILLGYTTGQVFFTSGGTESNNWAIKGALFPFLKQGGHIITSSIEHPSVLMTIQYMVDTFGFTSTSINPKHSGAVCVDDVLGALQENTRLVSIMFANNETGVIQPIEAIGAALKQHPCIFHVDAVQMLGKKIISLQSAVIDLLTFSGHKFYAPKGVGGLYVQEGVVISELLHGGGQEFSMRSGTENLAGIAAMAQAAQECIEHGKLEEKRVYLLKDILLQELQKLPVDFSINGTHAEQDTVPNTLNICIQGLRAEALAALLNMKYGYMISLGSACSNNKTTNLSHVLKAMGLSREKIQASFRVSFGRYTLREHVLQLTDAIHECVTLLALQSSASQQSTSQQSASPELSLLEASTSGSPALEQ